MDSCLMLAVSAVEPTWLEMIGTWVWMILGVAGGLTFVIFVHELGHFLVAKACGVKCEKFYVGFDFFEIPIPFTKWKLPRSLFKFQWGETEYGLGSLPLGGYVKMLGQDDDPRNAEAEAARIRTAAPAASDARVEAIASGDAAEGLVAGQSVEKLTNEALAAAHVHDKDKPADPPVPAQTTAGRTILLDPRSFPAKSVLARMAIISAGVIMNLIFAVIMATVAFRLGVKEMPAVIGATSPGGAAWVEGLQPGSRLIQIGERGRRNEFLSFTDFRQTAMLNNGRPVKLLVREPDGKEDWHELTPTTKPGGKSPMIGIAPAEDLELNIWPGPASYLNPKSSAQLLERDKVVEAAGQKVASGAELGAVLAQQPLGQIAIKVERRERQPSGELVKDSKQQPQFVDVTLEPRPMRELGLTMKMGPIVAVRKNSPAQLAGLLPDDTILEIDGEPPGDPLSLSQRLTPKPGSTEPLKITVQRKDRQGQPVTKTLEVTPEPPLQSALHPPAMNPTSIESIGVAFAVMNEVNSVDSAGPAGAAGLRAGDFVTKLEFIPGGRPEDVKKIKKIAGSFRFDALEFAETKDSWIDAVVGLQMVPADTKIKLTWLRGKQTMSAVMSPRDSATFFDDRRGLKTYALTQTQIGTNWGDAFQAGAQETVERVEEVLVILYSLVTGRLPATNLSGPPGILMAAAGFASEGFSSLLMFLVILSANLAVLNFLPIPVLDGGHMLFLTYEGVRGKPASGELQYRLTLLGLLCLLALMVFASAMDIGRFAELIRNWF